MLRVLARQKAGLNIVHINAQSLNRKMDEFRHLFVSADIDIICVSESWFPLDVHDSVFDLFGFKLFRSDRKVLVNGTETRAKGGGVAVYVRNGIHCRVKLLTKTSSQIEYLFLDISTFNNRKLLLGAVYRPNSSMDFSPFISILEEISIPYDDIVIIGDFNNNLLVDNTLSASMLSLHLNPVNTSAPTHFLSTSNSLIDLVFVNHKAKVLLYDQISASCFSNHDVLFLTYDISMPNENKYISFRDFRSIDYSVLNSNIENICWDQIYSLDSVNDQLSLIQENISLLYNMCVPIKTKVIKPNQQPWFNSDIKLLIKKRDDAYCRWKRFRTDDLKAIHKSARKLVTIHIRLAKILYYRGKFSHAMDNTAKWREIRKIGIGQKNTSACNLVANVNVLNDQFVNINVPSPSSNIYDEMCWVSVENPFSFRCVQQSDVLEGITLVKSNAIGSDDLDPKFLKALTPKLLPYYTHLFNTIFTKSTFPDKWKQSKIIPIPKSKHEFRPIAILPFLSKVMENLIAKQMDQYLVTNNFISDFQSGFRKSRSCTTALLDVTEDLRTKLDDNLVAILVLLDHSKAFDTVDHKILISKLRKIFLFSRSACELINSYLTNRYQMVHLNNNISVPLMVTRGVPQGSILGPLLFCLYINDLPDALCNCKVHMYADDVQLFTGARTENVGPCVDSINSDLNNINSWATANGLCINPSKSKCLIISKSNRALEVPEININGIKINFVKSASNLGIIFNAKLSWSDHINVVVGRVYSMLRNLWAVIDSTPLAIRMQLAKTYLIPVLLYGCEIFANCDSEDKRKLNLAYNNIARYVFVKGRRDHISLYSYQIFHLTFENVLKIKCLVFLHKIIISKQPTYLFNRLQFARSNRGRKIIQLRYKTLLSQRQFLIYTTSLWNSLPNYIQHIDNANLFKRELCKLFS